MTTATALTLYGIENHLSALLDTVEGMEESDPLRPAINLEIAETGAAELSKVNGVCRMLAHFDAQAGFAVAETKRLQTRKARFERSAERLATYAKLAMETAGKTKIDGETSILRLQANPASVLIIDEVLVPVSYKTLVPESWTIRKADVARDLKAGKSVPGADLSEGNMRLVRA